MTTLSSIDPLAAFMEGAVAEASRRPIPHVSTAFEVEIRAGLAMVQATRVFRNDEDRPIEAILTVPVPVLAAVYEMEAVIGGRRLVGQAKSRLAARQSYETAIDQGKAAVLHEETLRGVHTLSVAHLAPGAQIEVRCAYVQALSRVGETLSLRIPTTVGDIYGRSPLAEADDLISGGPASYATLTVRAEGPVRDRLGQSINPTGIVRLDRPIDISVETPARGKAHGLTAGGERFDLVMTPRPPRGEPLRLAILVDRSGSMGGISYLEGGLSKHQSVVQGLVKAAEGMGRKDAVRLWQFDDHCELVFAGEGRGLAAAAAQLAPPSGGTEIGGALQRVLVDQDIRDILLITDGKSYALDVQSLAREGRRISVLLVGEDSLEANVGHLAALTGGEVLVCGAEDLAAQLAEIIGRLRAEPAGEQRTGPAFELGGLTFAQSVSEAPSPDGEEAFGRAVGAFVASRRMAGLAEADAAELAAAEGLVTHLTSLVLLDEAGALHEGLPGLRKIPLSAIATALPVPAPPPQAAWAAEVPAQRRSPEDRMPGSAPPMIASSASGPRPGSRRGGVGLSFDIPTFLKRPFQNRPPEPTHPPAADGRIDWGFNRRQLAKGDVSSLPEALRERIKARAALPEVIEAAKAYRCSPILMAIALEAAEAALAGDRSAAMVARAILGFDSPKRLQSVVRAAVELRP